MIEIIDRVLQFLKDILLALALARHVGQRPDGQAAVAAALAERPHPQPQPARRPALQAGDPDLFLQALAFARRLEQPVDGFRGVGVADEHALHRPHLVGIRIDQVQIGGVGVDDAAVAIGDEDAVEGLVDDRLDQWVGRPRRRQAQDAGGKREQRKYADRGQHREEDENVGLGAALPQHDEGGGRADQECGDQEHQDDTAGARRAGAAIDRFAGAGG